MGKKFFAEMDEAFDCLLAALGLKKINPLGDETTFLGSLCKFKGNIKCADRTIINGTVLSEAILITNELIIGDEAKIVSGRIEADKI